MNIDEARKSSGGMPNFCSLETLFPLVMIGQLLAFVLVLRPGNGTVDMWRDLALTSLFVQWVVLSCAAALCVLGRVFKHMRINTATITAYLVVVVITGVLSEVAYLVMSMGVMPLEGASFVITPAALTVASSASGASTLAESDYMTQTALWLTQHSTIAFTPLDAVHWDFLIRTTTIGAIVAAVAMRYMHLQAMWKRDLEARARARVEALQARIRPHFLFNSMNTIASFARSEPHLAEQVVEDLSDLFRASLADDAEATWASEIALAQGYLRIESLRLGERLQVHWDVASLPPLARVPPLTLQPLVENAVYHGIEPLAEGGLLHIEGRVDGERVIVTITNPLPNSVLGTPVRAKAGHRLAQQNVHERLLHRFGEAVDFEVIAEAGFYRVRFVVPKTGGE